MLQTGSISSLLHTPQVSWKAACSIFRHVWTGFSAVCLPPVSVSLLTLCLTPTFSAWLAEVASNHKHLSHGWQKGNRLISTSSFFPRFSLSVTCLLISYCVSARRPPLFFKTFYPFVYLSHASFPCCCDIWPLPVGLRQWSLLIQDGILFVFVYPLFCSYGPFLKLMGLFDWVLCGCGRWLAQIL